MSASFNSEAWCKFSSRRRIIANKIGVVCISYWGWSKWQAPNDKAALCHTTPRTTGVSLVRSAQFMQHCELSDVGMQWPILDGSTEQAAQPSFHSSSSWPMTSSPYSAFFAVSRRCGAVVICVPFFSISAAHRAAPTISHISACNQNLTKVPCLPVLVKLSGMLANGISSRRVATIPKL